MLEAREVKEDFLLPALGFRDTVGVLEKLVS
jgi:hypothetical protein